MTTNLAKATLSQASDLLRAHELSVTEVVEYYISRISEFDEVIQAWVCTDVKGARSRAHALDLLLSSGTWLGPLHGIPIGVKDIYDVAGLPTGGGSSLREGIVPRQDAVSVQQLKRAGAIVLGKTVTTELGHSVPGPTRNPWNVDHTPGGSSSGSAAAVSANMCLGALGSQTFGSVIRPAAYCGIVGFKPTYGSIDRTGILPLAPTLDTPGIMTRSVRDAAMMFEALVALNGDSIRSLQKKPSRTYGSVLNTRSIVGVPTDFRKAASSDTNICLDRALDTLKEQGIEAIEVDLPASARMSIEVTQIIAHVEIAALHVDLYRDRGDEYSATFRRTIERGLMMPGVSYVRAQQIRKRALIELRDLFGELELSALITPAAAGPAPTGLESTGDPAFNTPFTLLGMPVITVPMGFVHELPVGLQVAGLPFMEEIVLTIAATYEKSTAWTKEFPAIN